MIRCNPSCDISCRGDAYLVKFLQYLKCPLFFYEGPEHLQNQLLLLLLHTLGLLLRLKYYERASERRDERALPLFTSLLQLALSQFLLFSCMIVYFLNPLVEIYLYPEAGLSKIILKKTFFFRRPIKDTVF